MFQGWESLLVLTVIWRKTKLLTHNVVNKDRSWMQTTIGGPRDFVFVDGIAISEEEYARLYAKPEPETKEAKDSLSNGKTQYDPYLDQYIFDIAQDSTVPTHNQGEFKPLSPGSIYRGPGDQRPLSTKAFKFVKKGAEGIASISRTAVVEVSKVSWTTSKQVIDKFVELQNLAAPVLAPIFQAVFNEGSNQLVGPLDKGSKHEHIQHEAPNHKPILQQYFMHVILFS
jgi:hypothetical protein